MSKNEKAAVVLLCMPVTLWPRQEVLQLIVPQLAQNGKSLTNELVMTVVRRLSKFQNVEGRVSFDRWFVVAKEVLKWNDSCTQLFWEMLLIASWYTLHDDALFTSFRQSNDELTIVLKFLAIFLVLHVEDPLQRPSSPRAAYDTPWPSLPLSNSNSGDEDPQSPVSSHKGSHSILVKLPAPLSMGSSSTNSNSTNANTVSPRSPRQQQPNRPTSPKQRAHQLPTPRQYRSSSQQLHSLKQKIHILLRVVSVDEPSLQFGDEDSMIHNAEYTVSKQAFDSLGFVIAGGVNRDQEVNLLSKLCRLWNVSSAASTGSSSSKSTASTTPRDAGDSYMGNVSSTDLAQWIESHLSLNDSVQPNCPSPMAISPRSMVSTICLSGRSVEMENEDHIQRLASTSGRDGSPSHGAATSSQLKQGHFQMPCTVISPISMLNRSTPTIVNNCCTTVIHIVTPGPMRKRRSTDPPAVTTAASSLAKKDNYMGDSDLSDNDAGLVKGKKLDYASTSSNMSVVDAADGESDCPMAEAGDSGSAATRKGMRRSNSGGGSTKSSKAMSSSIGRTALLQANRMSRTKEVGASFDQMDDEFDDESSDEAEMDMADSRELANLNLSGSTSFQRQMTISGKGAGGGGCAEPFSLPQCSINGCARSAIYLLAPYSNVYIGNCCDCEIIIGSVAGAVVVSSCDRVVLTCASRKLIAFSCLDCQFNVSTLSTSIIAGDSRGLVFGPHNANYRSLKCHLRMAGLSVLYSAAARTAAEKAQFPDPSYFVNSAASGKHSSPMSDRPNTPVIAELIDLWAVLCDVNVCVDAPHSEGSPTGYALDAAAVFGVHPPTQPPHSTAALLSPAHFRYVAIPHKQEISLINSNLIPLQSIYQKGVASRHDKAVEFQQGLDAYCRGDSSGPATTSTVSETSDGNEESRSKKAVKCAEVLNARFMEWLVKTGKVHQILDLIKMDADKAGLKCPSLEL